MSIIIFIPRVFLIPLRIKKISGFVDKNVIKVREFEHNWIHFNKGSLLYRDVGRYEKGFDGDWENLSRALLVRKPAFRIPLLGNELTVSTYARKNAAIIAGSRVFSYKYRLYNHGTRKGSGFVATHFDGVANLYYNLAYLMSVPAKAISWVRWVFSDPNIYKSGFFLASFTKLYLLIWGVLQLLWGICSAFLMLALGSILGLVLHPLRTLGYLTFSLAEPRINLISSLWSLFVAMFKPLWNIIRW